MRRLPLLVLAIFALSAAPVGASEQNVRIADGCGPGPFFFCYSPSALTVSSGDRVTWTNKSITPVGHNIVRCTPDACNGVGGGTGTDKWAGTGTIHQGGTYSHTFTGAGTYVYYCSIHGYAQMHGTITVQGSSSQPVPTPPPPPPPAASKLSLRKIGHHRLAVSFKLSGSDAVKVVIRRTGKTYRMRTLRGVAGRNTTLFAIGGLRKGRYTVIVTPRGGRPARASFRV